jgi:hypothetical protein
MLITRVAKVRDGGIRLDMAGATLRLDIPNLPDMVVNHLLDLLNRGSAKAPWIRGGRSMGIHD